MGRAYLTTRRIENVMKNSFVTAEDSSILIQASAALAEIGAKLRKYDEIVSDGLGEEHAFDSEVMVLGMLGLFLADLSSKTKVPVECN